MTSEGQTQAPRFRIGLAGMAWRAGFLVLAYAALTWVAYLTGGRGVGANAAERIANGAGAALIPWAVGAAAFFFSTRGRAARPLDALVSALAMVVLSLVTLGPRFVGQLAGEEAVERDRPPGLTAYLDELKRDYPAVYAQREALVDQRASMTPQEWASRLTVLRRSYERPALQVVSDATAMRLLQVQLDELGQAKGHDAQACAAVAKGARPEGAISEASRDAENGLLAVMLHEAAAHPPKGATFSDTEVRDMRHRMTLHLAPAELAQLRQSSLAAAAGDPTKAQVVCDWQILMLQDIVAQGPASAGKYFHTISAAGPS